MKMGQGTDQGVGKYNWYCDEKKHNHYSTGTRTCVHAYSHHGFTTANVITELVNLNPHKKRLAAAVRYIRDVRFEYFN